MDERPQKILFLGGDAGEAERLRQALAAVNGLHFHLEEPDRAAVPGAPGGPEADVILLDLAPAGDLGALRRARRRAPGVPIVVLAPADDARQPGRLLRAGAQDCLVRGEASGAELVRSLRYAVDWTRRRRAEEGLLAVQEEFRVARQIQQNLYPPAAPLLPGYDLAGAAVPAEATGGNYFDYLRLPDGSVALAVGDVSSHGFGPALLMAETRAFLHAFALTFHEVGAILARVNRVLADDVGESCFVSLLLARLDPQTRRLDYANAGHRSGFVLDASGAVKAVLKSTSVPLGIWPDGDFPAAPPLALEDGDLVFFLTDGIVEARGPDDVRFGLERALKVVRLRRELPARGIG